MVLQDAEFTKSLNMKYLARKSNLLTKNEVKMLSHKFTNLLDDASYSFKVCRYVIYTDEYVVLLVIDKSSTDKTHSECLFPIKSRNGYKRAAMDLINSIVSN